MNHFVTRQIRLFPESGIADLAVKGFPSRVLPLVLDQAELDSETGVAIAASKRLFPRVNPKQEQIEYMNHH